MQLPNTGSFVTIAADPPWRYDDQVHAARVRGVQAAAYGPDAGQIRGRRGAEGYYEVMSIEAITGLPVGLAAAPHAHLYLWCTNARSSNPRTASPAPGASSRRRS